MTMTMLTIAVTISFQGILGSFRIGKVVDIVSKGLGSMHRVMQGIDVVHGKS